MSDLRIEWGFDSALLEDGLQVAVTDADDSGTVTVPAATYGHVDMSIVLGSGEFTAAAAALQTAIRAVLTTAGTETVVSFDSDTASYTVVSNWSEYTLDFRSSTLGSSAGINLARILGLTSDHPYADAGSGYDVRISVPDAIPCYSNVRPYYILAPTIEARSHVSDEYEAEGVMVDAEADDGGAVHSSKDGSSIWYDWIQMAETDTPPAAHSDSTGASGSTPTVGYAGGAVFKRSATSEIPWSYQHAWEHLRSGGSLPFLVDDVGASEQLVHRMRADGGAFKPQRMASTDYDLWNVPFKTRLLGRL